MFKVRVINVQLYASEYKFQHQFLKKLFLTETSLFLNKSLKNPQKLMTNSMCGKKGASDNWSFKS